MIKELMRRIHHSEFEAHRGLDVLTFCREPPRQNVETRCSLYILSAWRNVLSGCVLWANMEGCLQERTLLKSALWGRFPRRSAPLWDWAAPYLTFVAD